MLATGSYLVVSHLQLRDHRSDLLVKHRFARHLRINRLFILIDQRVLYPTEAEVVARVSFMGFDAVRDLQQREHLRDLLDCRIIAGVDDVGLASAVLGKGLIEV